MLTPQSYNPKVHHVLDGEPHFMESVRSQFPMHGPTMFLYKHEGTGNFVIAGWTGHVRHGGKRMVDLVNLGPELGFSRERMHELKMILTPPQAADSEEGFFDEVTGKVVKVLRPRDMQRMENEQERELLREQMDDLEEISDLKRSVYNQIRKRGQGDSPFYADARENTPIKPGQGKRIA